jgi:hypothetical protein
MNHQQPSALSSTLAACPLPLTSQELLDIRTALAKWTETSLPEQSTHFAQRALLMFKVNDGAGR